MVFVTNISQKIHKCSTSFRHHRNANTKVIKHFTSTMMARILEKSDNNKGFQGCEKTRILIHC